MADTKISALTELTPPAKGDFFTIVDTSAGETKKIDFNKVAIEFNVLGYGADNSGATDASVACQAALDAAATAGGGSVYFPAGVYIVGLLSVTSQVTGTGHKVYGLTVGDNITVYGDGIATEIKMSTEDFTYSGGDTSTAGKATTFTNADHTGSGNSNITIRDIKINGNRAARISASSATANEQEGMDFVDVTNLVIDNVYVTEATHDSIDCDNSTGLVIKNTTVQNPSAQANNMWDGVHATGSNIRVTDCYFQYCGDARLNDGSAAPFDGLDGAVNVAGTEMVVANNVMDKCSRGVNISTNSPTNDVVVSGNVIQDSSSNGIEVGSGCSEVSIVGNVVDQANLDGLGGDLRWCIISEATGTVINDNVVTDAANGVGIRLHTTSTGGIISGNYVSCTDDGIHAASSGLTQITNNQVRGNLIGQGILGDTGACIISGNTITSKPSSSTRGAITVKTSAGDSTVINNTIQGTGAGRAILCSVNDCIISGNNIPTASSSGYEIAVSGNTNLISGNRISAASTDAIIDTGTSNYPHGNMLNGSTATAASADSIDVTGATTPISGADNTI